jgi:hypothetical protein
MWNQITKLMFPEVWVLKHVIQIEIHGVKYTWETPDSSLKLIKSKQVALKQEDTFYFVLISFDSNPHK